MYPNFRQIVPGPITPGNATELNAMARLLERLAKMTGSHPIQVSRESGVQIRFNHPLADLVRVTSTTTTDGRYPAKLLIYDAENDTYSDADDIWAVELNGGELTSQRYIAYEGEFAGGRKVYIAVEPFGIGNSKINYPDQLTSDQDDYDPGPGDVIIIDQDSSYFIGGIDTTNIGNVIVIFNNSDYVLTIPHEKSSSTAEYRIKTPTETDSYLPPKRAMILSRENETANRWIISGDTKDIYFKPSSGSESVSTTLDVGTHREFLLNITAAGVDLEGITSSETPKDGDTRYIQIIPGSTYGSVVKHEDSGTSASERITTANGVDTYARPGSLLPVRHNGTNWVLPHLPPNTQFVRATSTSATSSRYAGQWLHPVTATPGSWTTKDNIWIVFSDDSAPDDTSTNYPAWEVGYENGRPVFLAWKPNSDGLSHFHGFKIIGTSTQSLTPGSMTDVQFDTTVYERDTNGYISIDLANEKVNLLADDGDYYYYWTLGARVYVSLENGSDVNAIGNILQIVDEGRVIVARNKKEITVDSTFGGFTYIETYAHIYPEEYTSSSGDNDFKVQVNASSAVSTANLLHADQYSSLFWGSLLGRFPKP